MHVSKIDFIALQKYLYDEVEVFKAGPKPYLYEDHFSIRKTIQKFCEAHGIECSYAEATNVRNILFDLKIVRNELTDDVNNRGIGYVVKKPNI